MDGPYPRYLFGFFTSHPHLHRTRLGPGNPYNLNMVFCYYSTILTYFYRVWKLDAILIYIYLLLYDHYRKYFIFCFVFFYFFLYMGVKRAPVLFYRYKKLYSVLIKLTIISLPDTILYSIKKKEKKRKFVTDFPTRSFNFSFLCCCDYFFYKSWSCNTPLNYNR